MWHLPVKIVLRTHCAGKAGADVLFEDPVRKSSTLGVTVNPIRMDSLEAFGDLDAVASRLLQAEKAKVCQGLCCKFPSNAKSAAFLPAKSVCVPSTAQLRAFRDPYAILFSSFLRYNNSVGAFCPWGKDERIFVTLPLHHLLSIPSQLSSDHVCISTTETMHAASEIMIGARFEARVVKTLSLLQHPVGRISSSSIHSNNSVFCRRARLGCS